MNRCDARIRLISIIGTYFSVSNLDSELICCLDLIDDLGMDSLSFVSIIIEIESAFKIIIPDNMIN